MDPSVLSLGAIPATLQWSNPPQEWQVTKEGALIFTAGERTDLFSDPEGAPLVNNSPRLTFKPEDPFILSAKVAVDFEAWGDAGALLIYRSDISYAKLCFEFSHLKQPTIVSVVTRGTSDDCNSIPVDGNESYLRLAKLDRSFAFHYSTDGQVWHLIRYFTLENPGEVVIGFTVQSPMGRSCTASFSEITYSTQRLEDIRSGE
jgi:regulation of enolase protein 1 (concanavalin A-like superfamily)